MVIAEEKVELRKYFKRLRSQLTAEQAASGSLLTARQILACDAYRKANCIMGYLAFGNELSVDLVLQQALADGQDCCRAAGAVGNGDGSCSAGKHAGV